MKILLIRPKPHRSTIGLQSVMICEPLELTTLAAVLRANGHIVVVIDMILERRPLTYFIREERPDLIGLTGYISHIGVMKDYARVIKAVDRKISVCVGGVHAAVCPEDFNDPHIDHVCQTAEAFYKITDCVDLSPRLPDRNLPERYLKRYYYLFQNRAALIKTSFGCPYNCNFCFCKEIASYSARDIEDVIDELTTISQQEVYIVDDDFLFNRDRLIKFCELLEARNIRKHFLVYGRSDFIAANEDIIGRLAKNGLTAVIVGLESASQDELDAYNKHTKLGENISAVRILRRHNIECYATVILRMDWGKTDFKRLYQFLKDLDVVFVNLQPFTPMPGTDYWDEYKSRLLIPYEQPEKWDMAHLVVEADKLSARQYYAQIVKLYYKITITPKHTVYMFKRYGLKQTVKLSGGALRITMQYLAKIIRG
ncbi:MAG: cobalamin-dependent protein [Clostridiales Family XIII bacterium]|jgi:radical SAM superfamily enzyme YgiQ (UPF0313 family)|nr:cobalamin-dependent protein [Clostridiales Family XIII bacterium]